MNWKKLPLAQQVAKNTEDISTLNSNLTGKYVAGSEDLNTYYGPGKTGFYNIGGTAPANCPSVWAQLFVNTQGEGATQILMTEHYIYTRRRTGSPATWTSWKMQWLYDADWVTLTKDGTNSYAKYRVRGNVVTVVAIHKVSSQAIATWANYIFGQIPTTYRPHEDVYARIVCDRATDDGCSFNVGANGNVYISGRYTGAQDTSDVLYGAITYVI